MKLEKYNATNCFDFVPVYLDMVLKRKLTGTCATYRLYVLK